MKRLSAVFLILTVLLTGAGLSYGGAILAVNVIEDSTEIEVRRALDQAGLTWAEVQADGLQVYVSGDAPSEALRFKALSTAGGIVDAARVVDQITVQNARALAPPTFSIEILRNDSGLSLIGLIPSETDRGALVAAFQKATPQKKVADLLETSDFASPDGWRTALDFAIQAAQVLPRSKISVRANGVTVSAIADSADRKAQLLSTLYDMIPQDLRVDLKISAPRPVITPFTLRFLIDNQGARFDACSADTEAARDEIAQAARAAGFTGEFDCEIALGVPTVQWAKAVTLSIKALAQIGAGVLTVSDVDIDLIAPAGTPVETFDRVVGELENQLPDLFSLHPTLLKEDETKDLGPPEFSATLSPERDVQLRGRLPDALTRQAVASFAKAQFPGGRTHMAARLDPKLPSGWPVRAMVALEALAKLHNGSLMVTPDKITLKGQTGNPDAKAEITRLLSEQLEQGAAFDLNVTYLESLDPSTLIPTPQECLADIRAAAAENPIKFEPSSATITPEAQPTMDKIADILKVCGPIRLEVQGHTDSQGRESMNLTLSQSRAEAVIEELMRRRILVSNIVAKGYGESLPIADNDTEEGREANRRIEFVLLDPSSEDGAGDTTAQSEGESLE